MVRHVAWLLLAVGYVAASDVETALASDTECADETCALNALQQKQAVLAGLAEESVAKFETALEEGDAQEEKLEMMQEDGQAEKAAESEEWGSDVFGQSPSTGHSPSLPVLPSKYCTSKIESSSCMLFDCAKSRGPSSCNTTDYTCHCKPGYCSDGKGCVSVHADAKPAPGFSEYHATPGFCETRIQSSSCMIFECAASRGPSTCNTTDYFCHCQPGFCSDGKGAAADQLDLSRLRQGTKQETAQMSKHMQASLEAIRQSVGKADP
ncbi:hypothetical protein AK812_SmicGene5090 [Symbiodinium microadriaticum]|uniref:EGF-like domain-containing protein n=1 Tax=Symbiodinium microadriaticum TaxID=2951 RepID=A0A1Q9EUM3_SYMMI|nr:hypothetical protein AK812_SmicGene5090 [Symbiodinium microadriaticum]